MGLFDKFFSLFKRKKDKEPPSEDKEETKPEELKEETPIEIIEDKAPCLLYTSPSPRDRG